MNPSIPTELWNERGLRKMKSLLEEMVRDHGNDCPQVIRLRQDIEEIENILQDEPFFARALAQ